MSLPTLEEFLATYAGGENASRIVLDLTVDDNLDIDSQDRPLTPFIIVRDTHGNAVVINPQNLTSHLSVDVHPFKDGEDARAGVFGMEEGHRVQFPTEQAGGTSHGWPGAKMVVLMVGEQEETS